VPVLVTLAPLKSVRKVVLLREMLLLAAPLSSGPAKVTSALPSIRIKSNPVATVLPLSVMRGSDVVLVKLEPSLI